MYERLANKQNGGTQYTYMYDARARVDQWGMDARVNFGTV